jgi:microcystin-dependent protein
MSDPYVGEIRLFAGNFAPNGWLFCQGQLLAISDYDTLFVLVGTTYGGDGQETFAIPNLASRVPVHQGPGYGLAQVSGTESVTLTPNQLPAHTHPLLASTANADATTPSGNVWAQWNDSPYATGTPTTSMSGAALAATGGGQPHDNMAPFLALNFIISLFGIFPSQS